MKAASASTIDPAYVPGSIAANARAEHDQAVAELVEVTAAAKPFIDAHRAMLDRVGRGDETVTAHELLAAELAKNRAVAGVPAAQAKVNVAAAAYGPAEVASRTADLEAEARALLNGDQAAQIGAARLDLVNAQQALDDLLDPWAQALKEMGLRLSQAGFPRMENPDGLNGVRWTGSITSGGVDSDTGLRRWIPGWIDGIAVDGVEYRAPGGNYST
jgi:hypothetical protein